MLKGNLELLVMSILAAQPRHGYAIIEALRADSADAFDLPEGTLYPVLHRLEASGLIVGAWSEVGGRRRKSYTLTQRGMTKAGITPIIPASRSLPAVPTTSTMAIGFRLGVTTLPTNITPMMRRFMSAPKRCRRTA